MGAQLLIITNYMCCNSQVSDYMLLACVRAQFEEITAQFIQS
jgi:hypothetical protein